VQPAKTLTPDSLKTTRLALGLSRKELAERIGVDYLTVRRWEQPGVVIPRMAEVAFTAVMIVRREELEMMTMEEATEFARKHGMKVEEFEGLQGLSMLRVTYPSGEAKELVAELPATPRIIVDMTCNLL